MPPSRLKNSSLTAGAPGENGCFGEKSNSFLGLLIFNLGFFDLAIKRVFWKCFVAVACALHMRTSLSNNILSVGLCLK